MGSSFKRGHCHGSSTGGGVLLEDAREHAVGAQIVHEKRLQQQVAYGRNSTIRPLGSHKHQRSASQGELRSGRSVPRR